MSDYSNFAVEVHDVDPRLEEALGSARSKKNPSKVEIAALETEFASQKEEGYTGPIYGKEESYSSFATPIQEESYDSFATKVEEDSYDSFAKPVVKETDNSFSFSRMAKKGGQNFVNLSNSIGEVALNLAAAHPLIAPTQKGGDYLREMGASLPKTAQGVVASDEEMEAGGTLEKIGGNVMGMSPLLALGLPGVIAGGAAGGWQAGKGAIDAGESVGTAQGAALLQGGASAAGFVLPAAGKTVQQTLGLVSLNPVVGAVADKATELLVENQKLKEAYDWTNPVNRGTELVFGGVAGKLHHSRMKNDPVIKAADKLQRDNPPQYASVIAGIHQSLNEYMAVTKVKSGIDPSQTPDDALRDLVQDRTVAATARLADPNNEPPAKYNAAQAAEIIYKTSTNAEEKALAKNLWDIAGNILLDKTEITTVSPYAVFGLRSDSGRAFKGTYRGETDSIFLSATAPVKRSTILHEISHAVTSDFIWRVKDVEEQIKSLTSQRLPIPDSLSKYSGSIKKVEELEAFRTFLVDRVKTDPRFNEPIIDPVNGKQTGTRIKDPKVQQMFDYYLGDVYEMVAALHTKSKTLEPFWDLLQNTHLTKAELETHRPGLQLENRGKFMDFLNTFRDKKASRNALTAEDVMIEQFYNLQSDITSKNRSVNEYSKEIGEQDTAISKVVDSYIDEPLRKHFFRSIRNAVTDSISVNEFKTNLLLSNNTDGMRKLVNTLGQTMWDRQDWLLRAMPQSELRGRVYDKQLLMLEDRSLTQFLKDEIFTGGKYKNQLGDDISKRGIDINNPSVLRFIKTEGAGAKIRKFIIDKAFFYSHKADQLYLTLKDESRPYFDLPQKSKYKVVDAASEWDKMSNSDALAKAGLQWPTDAMVRAKNPELTDTELTALKSVWAGSDRVFELADQIQYRLTNTHLEKTPGHMPRFHDGPYKVFVTKNTDPNQPDQRKVIKLGAFNSRGQALAYAAQARKAGYDIQRDDKGNNFHVKQYDEVDQGLISSFQEYSKVFFEFQRLVPEEMARLQEIENKAIETHAKQLMERQWVGGFIGEFGSKPDPSQPLNLYQKAKWDMFQKRKTTEIFDREYKGITEAWKNIMFMTNVYTPLVSIDTGKVNAQVWRGEIFEKMPETRAYVEKFARNFVSQNINHASWIDNNLRELSIRVGVNPNLTRNTVRTLRNALSAIRLRVNPANWTQNFLQPSHVVSWLHFTDSLVGVDSPKASALASFSEVMTPKYRASDEAMRAIHWAKENHILDALLENEIKSGDTIIGKTIDAITLSKVNSNIEGFSRTTSFLVAFNYYMKKFNNNEISAREAAQIAVNHTMVNYDHMSRPLMYQDYGVAGESISPFAVFRNAYAGNAYLMFKYAVQNKHNLPLMERMKPFLMQQLTFMMTAGAMGIIGLAEADLVISTINTIWPEMDLPSMQELITYLPAPDQVTEALLVGAASSATRLIPGLENGADISRSGSAVAAVDFSSFTMLPFVRAIAATLGITAKEVIALLTGGDRVSPETVYKETRPLVPGILQEQHERWFKGDDTNIAYSASSLEGTTRRDDADVNARKLVGKSSIKENTEKFRERAIKQAEERKKQRLKAYVEEAASAYEGTLLFNNNEGIDQLTTKAWQNLEVKPEEFRELVKKEVERRRTTIRERDIEKFVTEPSTSSQRKMKHRLLLERQ